MKKYLAILAVMSLFLVACQQAAPAPSDKAEDQSTVTGTVEVVQPNASETVTGSVQIVAPEGTTVAPVDNTVPAVDAADAVGSDTVVKGEDLSAPIIVVPPAPIIIDDSAPVVTP